MLLISQSSLIVAFSTDLHRTATRLPFAASAIKSFTTVVMLMRPPPWTPAESAGSASLTFSRSDSDAFEEDEPDAGSVGAEVVEGVSTGFCFSASASKSLSEPTAVLELVVEEYIGSLMWTCTDWRSTRLSANHSRQAIQ